MFVEKTFQTESGTLNYAEGPNSGPPLVLIHGITSNWTQFIPLMATLSQRWHNPKLILQLSHIRYT
jgi:hypothetical protein